MSRSALQFASIVTPSTGCPTILDLVTGHPCAIADLLELAGVTARELCEFIDGDPPF